MPFEKDENEIGALWQKESARGTYFTGVINGEKVVVFRNGNKKEGSKAPDLRVLKSKPKPEAADDQPF